MLLIGLGPHADRTYMRHLPELRNEGSDVQLCAIVDSAGSRDAVTARALQHGSQAELVFFEPFSDSMPAKTLIEFDRLVARHRPNAVIIATPPEAHRPYIERSLDHALNIMVDKPISTREGAVVRMEQAKGIMTDWNDQNRRYHAVRKDKPICMVVNTQRRFDPVFRLVCERIEEVRDRRGCPVTSVTALHADGQFRLPHELVEFSYHGFNRGNGKISHSGIHEIDMTTRLWTASWTPENKPDAARLISSLVQPDSLLHHIPPNQYREIFGPEYQTLAQYSNDEIAMISDQMGELDATLLIELLKGSRTIGQAVIGLHHNSVSARSWLYPRNNLYKQMGRLKHEQWVVQSGPFQTIVIETRQADDEHDGAGTKSCELGGPNHLEVKVFRNASALGIGQRLEVIHAHELTGFGSDRLHSEQVKMAALREFIGFVQGRIKHSDLRSDFSDHRLSVALMSGAYESHVRRRAGRSPFVTIKL